MRNASILNIARLALAALAVFSIEMLKQMAGIDVAHIPYKGGGPAVTALVGGEVDFEFTTALTAQPHVKSGRIRALSRRRRD